MLDTKLKITEIFYSLQGETTLSGLPTVFIRLTGCPLRCQYCDTTYAFKGGQFFSIAEILAEVAGHKTQHITVTGGEPLAQKNCLPLLTILCDKGYTVSLETSGALPVDTVDDRVYKILDIKTPGSGEVTKNHYTNLDYLNPSDEIKFVICDRTDFDWAAAFVQEHQLGRYTVLFSASADELDATTLAQWILDAKLSVRLQVQLHKLLWDNARSR